jgi:para-aminobenzoate synthetase/4-amino-4-deoxychorismate lyase
MKNGPVMTKNQAVLHRADTGQWLRFVNPSEIITTDRADEVVPALTKIESLVNSRGWYAAGFLSYEAANAFDPAFCTKESGAFPLLWFALYPKAEDYVLASPEYGAYSLSEPFPSIDRAEYDSAIERVKKYIQSGDTYQVNFTLRLRSVFSGDPFQLFLAMVWAQSAGYSSWIDTGNYAICSASPELFFHLADDKLVCKPMKGTVRRGRTLQEDKSLADWLHLSEKNRAENLMIVDMIRNDLGRVAEVGSVHVPRLFEVGRHQTLWQMTSTIASKCRKSFTEIMAALFPCASITGAPKYRTTEIIAELESSPRNLYTGCIGFLAPNRIAQFSVAIRTAVLNRSTSQIEYGSGGGIVWDSASQDEYTEALLKSRVLTEQRPEFSLLETMRWTPKDSYFLLDYHLRRLMESAEYFGFIADEKKIREALMAQVSVFADYNMRVRLLVSSDGRITIQSTPMNDDGLHRPLRIALAPRPVRSMDIFLFHKTTNRKIYEGAKQACPECDDVLLWNERQEITETSIANVVLRIGEDLYTPFVDAGLLAGTYRAFLLDNGRIRERVLTLSDLGRCSNIYLINSVREFQEARLIT